MRTMFFKSILICIVFGQQTLKAQQPIERHSNFLATVLSINQNNSVVQVQIEPTGRKTNVNLGNPFEIYSSMDDNFETIHFQKSDPIHPKSSVVGKRVWINAVTNTKTPSQYDARFIVQTERSGKEIEETRSVVEFLVKNETKVAEEFHARLYLCGRVIDRAKKLGRGNNPHILLGRIKFSGKENPRSISSQFQVMDKGYFVTTCLDSKLPISVDLHGFKPYEMLAKNTESTVENAGTVQLEGVTRHEISFVTFRLPSRIESKWGGKPINLYTRTRSFNSAGNSRFLLPDSTAVVGTRRSTNGIYKSVPLSPSLKYEIHLTIEGESYGSVITLNPGETRNLGELPRLLKDETEPKSTPSAQSPPAEIESQKLDRQYEAKMANFKRVISLDRERKQGGYVVAAKIRVENESDVDLSGKISSNFKYLSDGRMVGLIARADESFFIRALGYRTKELKISEMRPDFDKEVDFLDIGEILLSKLPSEEECSVSGTLRSSDGAKITGRIYISAHENRNSPGNALWGDSLRIEAKVDNTGKFEIRGLSPGRFSLVHGIQGFSSRSKSSEIKLGVKESLDLGEIVLDRLLIANVSWIWSDALPFKNQEAVQGIIKAENIWYATLSEHAEGYSPSDLRCIVDQGKLYFDCTHCPANYADLGTGEISDFSSITLDQAKVKFGRTAFTNGHVYFIQQLHTNRYILMKVNSVEVVKPLDRNANQKEIVK